MSNLTRDQLRAVAKAATDALRAELGLHDPDDDGPKSYFGEYVTGAQVRAVVEALESAGYLLARVDAIGPALRKELEGCLDKTPLPPSEPVGSFFGGPLPTPAELNGWGDPAPFPAPEPPAAKVADDNDDESPFADCAPDEIEDGGEDVETTPLREPYQVPAPVGTWTQKQQALYLRLAPLLQRLARDDYMPTMAQYDAQRGDLPTAMGVTLKLGLKWSELAARLGLAIRPRGHRFGKGKGMATDAAPDPEPEPEPEKPAVPRLRGTAVLDANGLVKSVSLEPDVKPILHRAPDGGVTRILPRPDKSQAHSLPSAFAQRNSDGRQVRPAYRTED